MSDNRKNRAAIAKETLEILNHGFYTSGGKKISIAEKQQYAQENSVLYKPTDFEKINKKAESLLNDEKNKTLIEVVNRTTLAAGKDLLKEGAKVVCLNFASAKNPGGGFIGGSHAQEESLARATGMYPCIVQMEEMYETNRKNTSCLYLDYMIYSPQVPVFRNDQDVLLEEPYSLSIITAPAVNAGAVKRNEPHNVPKIEPVMRSRIDKVLSIAVANNYKYIVLGAWGCGVFQNDPQEVAIYFKEALIQGKYAGWFEKVVFAVLDSSENQWFIGAFKEAFSVSGV